MYTQLIKQIQKVNTKIETPEYSTTQTSTASITSLPATVSGGELAVEVSGRTITNMLGVKGRFDTNVVNAFQQTTLTTDSSDKLFGTNSLLFTSSDVTDPIRYPSFNFDLGAPLKTGKYYILSGYVKGRSGNIAVESGNDGKSAIIVSNSGTADAAWTAGGVPNENRSKVEVVANSTLWKRYGLKIIGEDSWRYVGFRTGRTNLAGQSIFNLDGFQVTEISEDDYINLTTDELLEKYPYIDGTKSTDKTRILSVGKNLFDLNLGKISSVSDKVSFEILSESSIKVEVEENSNTSYAGVNIRLPNLKPNTTYTLSRTLEKLVAGTSTSNGYMEIEGITITSGARHISGVIVPTNSTTFTTSNPVGNPVIKLFTTFNRKEPVSVIFSNIQLEEGDSVTEYEPYKDSQSICNLPLRNVPISSDAFNGNTGIHRQNVSAPIPISNTQYTELVTTGTNVDIVSVEAYTLALKGTVGVDGRTRVYDSNGIELEEVAQADIDLVASVGKYYYATDGLIGLIVAKGAYPTIADARTGLATSIAYYQLAVPVHTQLLSSALIANSKGSVHQETFEDLINIYNNGLIIPDTNYPIDRLIEVFRVNTSNGQLTPVRINLTTIADNKQSLTISGAVNGDWYYASWRYPSELRINGVLNYSYSVNLKGQTDGNTKMIGRLNTQVNKLELSQNRFLSKNFTYDPPTIASGETVVVSIPVEGVKLGDIIMCSYSLDLENVWMRGVVVSSDTVEVSLFNITDSPINLAEGVIYIRVFQV